MEFGFGFGVSKYKIFVLGLFQNWYVCVLEKLYPCDVCVHMN